MSKPEISETMIFNGDSPESELPRREFPEKRQGRNRTTRRRSPYNKTARAREKARAAMGSR